MSKTTYDSVIYAGIFLTDETKETSGISLEKDSPLLQLLGNNVDDLKLHADHVTLAFRPTPSYLDVFRKWLGTEVVLEPIRIVADSKAAVAQVKLNTSLDPYLTHDFFMGQHMHITLATKKDVSPVYSNELLWRYNSLNHPDLAEEKEKWDSIQVIEAGDITTVADRDMLKGVLGVHTSTLNTVTNKEVLLPGTIETVGNIS